MFSRNLKRPCPRVPHQEFSYLLKEKLVYFVGLNLGRNKTKVIKAELTTLFWSSDKRFKKK